MPSRTRPRGAVTLLFGICALATLAIPTAAAAKQGLITPCAPELGRIKAYRGRISSSFEGTASGEDPTEGGAQTVSLSHAASNLFVYLKKGPMKKKGTDFVGNATKGTVTIADTNLNSGTGFGGTQTFNGPLNLHPPNAGAADLLIDRRKHKCRYEVALGYAVEGSYLGDPEVDMPIPAVGDDAYGPPVPLPGKTHLAHTETMPVYLSCNNRPLQGPGCYDTSGGWVTDFALLTLCHSVIAANCADDTQDVGAAELSWNLHPVYAKSNK